MKQLVRMTTLLVLLCAGIGFAACGDEDNGNDNGGSGNGAGTSAIVGSWKQTDPDGRWEMYTFHADGTGKYEDCDDIYDPFTYVYRPAENKVEINWPGDPGEKDVYEAVVNGNKLHMDGEDYIRQ